MHRRSPYYLYDAIFFFIIRLNLLTFSSPRAVSGFPFAVSRVVRLGVDYGPRRIGLAVASGAVARPLSTIHHGRNMSEVMRRIGEAASSYGASEVVVGVPLGREGGFTGRLPGFNARLCVSFARQFVSYSRKFHPGLAVIMCDERYTTREAKAMLSTGSAKGVTSDALAAACLLEGYVAEKGANSVDADAAGVFGLRSPSAEAAGCESEELFDYDYVARHVRKIYKKDR